MVYTDGKHLIAEDIPELHRFAESVGISRAFFSQGARHPHYNLLRAGDSELRKNIFNKCVAFGAVHVSTKTLIKISKRSYFFPTTEEEIKEFERKHKWELERPLTDDEREVLDRIKKNLIDKLFPPDEEGYE